MRFKFHGRLSAIILSMSATAAFAAGESPAPTPIALGGAAYTQNFDTLLSSGTTPTPFVLAGWRIFEGDTGTAADGQYIAGNGSNTAGNVYSFGATGSTERALGSLTSGSVSPTIFGAYFTNATGDTISSLAVSYFGEQWRRGATANDTLAFSYFVGTPTSLNAAGWTAVTTLNFLSPQATAAGAVDGNVGRTPISGTISGLSIAAGSAFAIRWVDSQVSPGTNDGLAIDDVSISAITGSVPEPASWAMMVGGFGLLGAALRRKRGPAFA